MTTSRRATSWPFPDSLRFRSFAPTQARFQERPTLVVFPTSADRNRNDAKQGRRRCCRRHVVVKAPMTASEWTCFHTSGSTPPSHSPVQGTLQHLRLALSLFPSCHEALQLSPDRLIRSSQQTGLPVSALPLLRSSFGYRMSSLHELKGSRTTPPTLLK